MGLFVKNVHCIVYFLAKKKPLIFIRGSLYMIN